MNTEKQIMAIAKACPKHSGWYDFVCEPDNYCWDDCHEAHMDMAKNIPNYLHDLNAMHQAELSLSDQSPGKDEKGNTIASDRSRYRLELCVVCAMNGGPIHATAAQRAEAFLKTLNLWEKE